MSNIKLKRIHVFACALIIIFISAFLVFGIHGLTTFLGFYFFLILPTYLIIRPFGLEQDEAMMFSFFLALVITPLIVWFVDRILGSIVQSTIVTSIILYTVGIHMIRRKKQAKRD